MKKITKTIVGILMALILTSSFIACGKDDGGKPVDPNKTQLYIAVYEGGLGVEWLDEIIKSFEAEYPQYQVYKDPGKGNFDSKLVYDNFDTYRQDIFFMDYCDDQRLSSFINAGYLANINDAVTTPLTEFGEDKSIADKITPFLKDYYIKENAVYALPWYQASYQMIYDVNLFTLKSYFKDSDGEWDNGTNKSVGQDGKAGTFDDGLPVTYNDFFVLLDKMLEDGVTPMTWPGNDDYYFTSMLTNLYANYAGYDDFILNTTLNGTHSTLGEINLNNAWKLKGNQPGQKYALDFAWDIITKKSGDYFSNLVFGTSQDNTAAQGEFVSGLFSTKPTGLLVDGTWWEREAKKKINLYATKGEEYAYGVREFGIMPFPQANDGSSNGKTLASTSGRSLVFVNNNTKKLELAKLFLRYASTNKMLSKTTAYSNTPRPYVYEMSDEDKALMTPYGRDIYEYYNNSQVVFDEIPLNPFLQSTKGYEGKGSDYIGYLYHFKALINTHDYLNPAKTFNDTVRNGIDVQKFLDGLKTNQYNWEKAVEAYQS